MTVPAPPSIDLSIGDVIAAALSADLAERELDTRVHCAMHLAHRTARMLGVTEGEAWEALTYVPDNLLHLLDSPQGWSALTGMIARDLGVAAVPFTPSVH